MFFVGKHRFSNTIEKDKQLKLWKKIELYNELKKQAFECKRIFESKKNNLNYFGELLNETWNIKKKLSKKVTSNVINEIYKEGTLNKSKMLQELHPDVAEVVWKFNRWHHHVDYRPFKNNELKKKKGLKIKKGINNYGMKRVKI